MNNHLDPTAVFIALGSALFGPQLAAVIGPYAVILIAATVGAAWSLGRRAPSSTGSAVRYFALLNGTAMLVTVQVANAMGMWLRLDDTSWLLAPIAMVIGGVGEAWPRIGRWAIERAGRIIERRTGSEGDKP